MGSFALLELGVDIALMLSLVFLAFRFVRFPRNAPQSREMKDLERMLKGLIADAEDAGRSLDEQLQKRREELEHALFDIERAENRVNRAVTGLRDKTDEIQEDRASAGGRKVPAGQAPVAQPRDARATKQEIEQLQRFAAPAPQGSLRSQVTRQTVIEEEPIVSWDGVNIFGQPLGQGPQVGGTESAVAAAPAVMPPQTLQPAEPPSFSIKQIYARAEELIRAGEELHNVVTRTRLPLEEVQNMAQMIAREELARRQAASEEEEQRRLGALNPIRRQSQIV